MPGNARQAVRTRAGTARRRVVKVIYSDGDGACVHRSVTNEHDAHNDQNPAMAITMMMRRRRGPGGGRGMSIGDDYLIFTTKNMYQNTKATTQL